MTPEESEFILSLRRRVQENTDAGRPSNDGITVEHYTRFLQIIRGNRKSADPVKSRAKAKKSSMTEDQLKALFQ